MTDKPDGNEKLPPIKSKKDDEDVGPPKEKFAAKNWKAVPQSELKKMSPQQRSKYLAYEEPPKDAAAAQSEALKRLVELKKRRQKAENSERDEELDEKEKHAKLIGQLKAAEARNRLRIMRLRYFANRGQEVNHLISCQPSALKAVRLQALLPAHTDYDNVNDTMEKLDRDRCEKLLEDQKGLLTHRT
ncbi:protein LKAAEAR1-like [Lineus longissimus]|uniref:protein LKAAEAR1-like n=1 Tax=Lineus longissimus TaxID=88925 RepID=UPI002B4E67BB